MSTTMSGNPSLSISAATMLAAPEPEVKVIEEAKEKLPELLVFLNTRTWLPVAAVAATSALPSPSKSATKRLLGLVPTV